MISIIVCSRNADVKKELRTNIDETIGRTPHELIVIDNSNCDYSIFQAYNQGVQRAKYPILCFIHEDIIFKSLDWGDLICRLFRNEEIGLLGVIGGYYMGDFSKSWGDSGLIRGQIIQGGGKCCGIKFVHNECHDLGCNVVAVDGLFLVSKKELFGKGILFWDENSYDGFHFYDMDISMQVLKAGLKIQIVDDLLIQHNSHSVYNESFYKNYKAFYSKWRNFLPVSSCDFSEELQKMAYMNILESNVQLGIRLYRRNKVMNYLPYRIATKIMLLLGYDVW